MTRLPSYLPAAYLAGYRSVNPRRYQEYTPALQQSPAATLPAQSEEEELDRSLVRTAVQGSIGGLSAVGNFLDVPGSVVRDLISWLPGGPEAQNPVDQLMPSRWFNSEGRVTGEDLLKGYGLMSKRKPRGIARNIGRFAAGLGTEILLDPLLPLSAGARALGAGGKAVQRAGLLEDVAGAATRKKRTELAKKYMDDGLDEAQAAAKVQDVKVGPREGYQYATPEDVANFSRQTDPDQITRSQSASNRMLELAGLDKADLKKPMAEGLFSWRIPGLVDVSVGGQKTARAADKLADAARFGNPVVPQLARIFDADVRDFSSPEMQREALELSRKFVESKSLAREGMFKNFEDLASSGLMDESIDPAQRVANGNLMYEYMEDIGREGRKKIKDPDTKAERIEFDEPAEKFAARSKFDPIRQLIPNLDDMKVQLRDVLDTAEEYGQLTNDFALRDEFASYAPRLFQSDAAIWRRPQDMRSLDTRDQFNLSRKAGLINLPGGTAQVNQMSIDKEFAGMGNKRFLSGQKRHDKESLKGEFFDKYNIDELDVEDEVKDELFDSIYNRPREDVESGIPMFNPNPFDATLKRIESARSARASAVALSKAIQENARINKPLDHLRVEREAREATGVNEKTHDVVSALRDFANKFGEAGAKALSNLHIRSKFADDPPTAPQRAPDGVDPNAPAPRPDDGSAPLGDGTAPASPPEAPVPPVQPDTPSTWLSDVRVGRGIPEDGAASMTDAEARQWVESSVDDVVEINEQGFDATMKGGSVRLGKDQDYDKLRSYIDNKTEELAEKEAEVAVRAFVNGGPDPVTGREFANEELQRLASDNPDSFSDKSIRRAQRQIDSFQRAEKRTQDAAKGRAEENAAKKKPKRGELSDFVKKSKGVVDSAASKSASSKSAAKEVLPKTSKFEPHPDEIKEFDDYLALQKADPENPTNPAVKLQYEHGFIMGRHDDIPTMKRNVKNKGYGEFLGAVPPSKPEREAINDSVYVLKNYSDTHPRNIRFKDREELKGMLPKKERRIVGDARRSNKKEFIEKNQHNKKLVMESTGMSLEDFWRRAKNGPPKPKASPQAAAKKAPAPEAPSVPPPKALIARAKDSLGVPKEGAAKMTDKEVLDFFTRNRQSGSIRKQIASLEADGVKLNITKGAPKQLKDPVTGQMKSHRGSDKYTISDQQDFDALRKVIDRETVDYAETVLQMAKQSQSPVWVKDTLKAMARGEKVDQELVDAMKRVNPKLLEKKSLGKWEKSEVKKATKAEQLAQARLAAASRVSEEMIDKMKVEQLKLLATEIGARQARKKADLQKNIKSVLEHAVRPDEIQKEMAKRTASTQAAKAVSKKKPGLVDTQQPKANTGGMLSMSEARQKAGAEVSEKAVNSMSIRDLKKLARKIGVRQSVKDVPRSKSALQKAINQELDFYRKQVSPEDIPKAAKRKVDAIERKRIQNQLISERATLQLRYNTLGKALGTEGANAREIEQKLSDVSEKMSEIDRQLDTLGSLSREVDGKQVGRFNVRDDAGDITGNVMDGTRDITEDGVRAFAEVLDSDPKTLAHESGHFFRASLRSVDPTTLRDAEQLYGVTDGVWSRVQEERFADDFMNFLETGRAKTGLEAVFQRFKDWIGTVYRKITRQPEVEELVSPEIREFFDKMLGPKQYDVQNRRNLKDLLDGTNFGHARAMRKIVSDLGISNVDQAKKLVYAKRIEAAREAARKEGDANPSKLHSDFFRKLEAARQANKVPPEIDGISTQVSPTDVLGEFSVPEDIYVDLAKTIDPSGKPRKGGALDGIMDKYDAFLNLFKTHVTATHPGFHARNFTSGYVQNVLNGIKDPRAREARKHNHFWQPYADAADLMTGKQVRGSETIPFFENMTQEEATDELRKLVFSYGLMDSPGQHRDMVATLGQNTLDMIPGWKKSKGMIDLVYQRGKPSKVSKTKDVINPAFVSGAASETDRFFLSKMGRSIGDAVEGGHRIGGFIALLRQGYEPAEAARRIKLLHVDYSNLSRTEREVMRRWFPFYSFSRGMVEYVTKELSGKPGGPVAQTIRAANRASDREASVPDYVSEGVSFPLGVNDDGTRHYLTGLGLMHEQPVGLLNPNPQKFLFGLASQLNPVPKAAVEAATNESLFQSSPQGGRSLDDLDPLIGRTASNVANTLGLSERKTPYKLPKMLELAAANSPAARYLSTTRVFFDPRKSLMQKTVGTQTGLRITSVSPGAQDAILRERAEAIIRDLGGKVFERPYFSQEEMADMDSATKEKAEQWMDLMRILGRRARQRSEQREELGDRPALPSQPQL